MYSSIVPYLLSGSKVTYTVTYNTGGLPISLPLKVMPEFCKIRHTVGKSKRRKCIFFFVFHLRQWEVFCVIPFLSTRILKNFFCFWKQIHPRRKAWHVDAESKYQETFAIPFLGILKKIPNPKRNYAGFFLKPLKYFTEIQKCTLKGSTQLQPTSVNLKCDFFFHNLNYDVICTCTFICGCLYCLEPAFEYYLFKSKKYYLLL